MTKKTLKSDRRAEMIVRALRYGAISALAAFVLYTGVLLLLAVREIEAFTLAAILAPALGALIAALSFFRDREAERDKEVGEANS